MSQQPYQPGQPGQPGQPNQPGQPGGYQQPGYPQGGYPQPGQPPQPGYGQYQGAGGPQPFGSPSPSTPSRGNPMDSPATLAPILQIVGYVVAVLGVIGGLFAFGIDGYPGSFKFVTFAGSVVAGLGFGGILVGLAAILKSRPTG